jgi:uncharacterized membrane protein
MILLIILAWPLVGMAIFVWQWTREYDLTLDEVPLLFAFALVGPFAVLVYLKSSTVLIKRRGIEHE